MGIELLVPVVTAAAVLTLKSDSAPAKIYVKRPRGTLYWGGAGLDGPYIQPQMEAFRRAGIKNVNVGLTNTANAVVWTRIGTLLDALRAGLDIRTKTAASG